MTAITHIYNEEDFQALLSNELSFYRSREHQPYANQLGAIELVSADYPAGLLVAVIEKIKAGYDFDVTAHTNMSSGYSFTFVTRPVADQEKDIESLTEQVREKYKQYLQEKYDQHLEKIVAESVARSERETLKKVEAAKERAIEVARKAAAEALGARPE